MLIFIDFELALPIPYDMGLVSDNRSEFNSWLAMRNRCYNTEMPYYENYGGRGIKVCDSWLDSFASFLSDLGPKPSSNHSLDRIDSNDDYRPSNCRWADHVQQAQNRRLPAPGERSEKLITYNGKTQNLSAWSKETGLSVMTLGRRLKRGLSAELILSQQDLRSKNS